MNLGFSGYPAHISGEFNNTRTGNRVDYYDSSISL